MKVTSISVDAVRITEASGLDPIHVFWMDVEPGKGYVTIICYGKAWTAYFGAMDGDSIQEFFARADVDYLVNKMYDGSKKRTGYITEIIKSVKDSLSAALPSVAGEEVK